MTATERAETGAPPARWWHALPEEGRVQCDLCPRGCRLGVGQRGMCFVRRNEAGGMRLAAYGLTSGLCVDPVEKKPLNHFLPGTGVLSFGTAGCNLGCRYCQNWHITKIREDTLLAVPATPEQLAQCAVDLGCPSVAFTYNDPVVFAEYAIDTAQACHRRGLKTIAVTAGYISPAARAELFACMDAANIDLKSFRDDFYRKLCLAHLRPVLDTLRYVRHETKVWLEITTLLIPGWNDGREELTALSRWIFDELGPDVPLHFSAFHPAFRMLDTPPTPAATLRSARDIAREVGLRYVYVGNLRDSEGQSTRCYVCDELLIERDGYSLGRWGLRDGRCARCGARLPGLFRASPGAWGSRVQPVHPEEREVAREAGT